MFRNPLITTIQRANEELEEMHQQHKNHEHNLIYVEYRVKEEMLFFQDRIVVPDLLNF